MIYKIKIRDIKTGKEDFVVMGDNYKTFRAHFVNIIDYWTEKWHYKDDSAYNCLGRTLTKEILQIWSSKQRFVSFGGLKMAYEENYDEEVEKHNCSDSYKPCKYLRHLKWKLESKEFLDELLKENRVIRRKE